MENGSIADSGIRKEGNAWDACSRNIVIRRCSAERRHNRSSLLLGQSDLDAERGQGAKRPLDMEFKPRPENVTYLSQSSLSMVEFIKDRFLPEHVAIKRSAGRAHFHLLLKHVLSPLDIVQVFGPTAGNARKNLGPDSNGPYIGTLKLGEVDAEAIQRLTSAALNRGYSIQTVTHIRNVIRSIFSHAIRTGCYRGPNPATLVNLPAVCHKHAYTVSLSHLELLLQPMGYPERELALLTILAEMSVAEICGLQWQYVNLSNNTRVLGPEVIPPRTIAVRNQNYRGELTPAFGSRKRFVRVGQPLSLLLRELRTRSRFTMPQDFVLVSRKGTPLHPENIAARRLKGIGRSFEMPWISWLVFHRTGVKLRSELGRTFDEEFEKLLSTLSLVPSESSGTCPATQLVSSSPTRAGKWEIKHANL